MIALGGIAMIALGLWSLYIVITAIPQRAAQDIADRLIADLIPQIGQRPTMRS